MHAADKFNFPLSVSSSHYVPGINQENIKEVLTEAIFQT